MAGRHVLGIGLALSLAAAALLLLPTVAVQSETASLPLDAPDSELDGYFGYLPVIARPGAPAVIEVTQAVQRPGNPVVLIAERPTMVRWSLTSTVEYAGVNGWVYGRRDGVPLPGSPLAALNNPRTVRATVNRANLDDTFNFALPESWRSGVVELQFTASNGATYNIARGPQTIAFTAAAPMHVTVVPIAYTCTSGGSGTSTPTPPYDYLTDYTFRVYPVPAIPLAVHSSIAYSGPCTDNQPNPTSQDWSNMLSSVTAVWSSEGGPNSYYYGLIDNIYCVGGCIAGMGWVGGYKVAVGFDGFGANHSGASETHAHEVGHNHGRYHAPGCGAGNPDPGYPYVVDGKGFIGDSAHPNFGFDVNSLVIYPYTSYYDFMSYCSPEWISDYTYEAIWLYDAAQRANPPTPVGERSLLVSGVLTPEGVTFRPAYLLNTPAYRPEPGDYTVELLDGAGNAVAAYPFAPVTIADAVPGMPAEGFFLRLPPAEGVEAVRVSRGGATLGLLQPGRRPPALRAGRVARDGDTLRWQAGDPDGDVLHYLVRVSADGGASWETVGVDLTGPTVTLDPRWERLDLLVEIVASDGLHTATLRQGVTR